MQKIIAMSLMGVAMVGCATIPTDYTASTKQISEPAIGSTNVAYIGDKLLVQGTQAERLALYIPHTQKLGLGWSVHQGHYPKSGAKEGYEYFMGGGGDGRITDMFGLSSPLHVVVLRKSDNAICVLNGVNTPIGCKTGLSFEVKNWVTNNANSFQQTLLYNGRVGNKINIAYREFSSDMARPAFNNEVEYDLSESNVIGYKGALIEVIEANNQMIRYKVVKNFNATN